MGSVGVVLLPSPAGDPMQHDNPGEIERPWDPGSPAKTKTLTKTTKESSDEQLLGVRPDATDNLRVGERKSKVDFIYTSYTLIFNALQKV